MAQETFAAVLRLKNAENNKEFKVSFTLPNSSKPTWYSWDAKNKFEAQIPTKVTYLDDHKKQVLFHTNYAKTLLEAYPNLLEFVKEVKRDEFVETPFPKSDFEDVPKVESVAEPENKKEKKNEKK